MEDDFSKNDDEFKKINKNEPEEENEEEEHRNESDEEDEDENINLYNKQEFELENIISFFFNKEILKM